LYIRDKNLPRQEGYEQCWNPRYWKDDASGVLTQRPCGSPRCPSCAPAYRRREAQILSLSFSIRPPDFTTTLKYHPRAKVRDTELQEHWRVWGESVRYWARKRRWRVRKKKNVEFSDGIPHVHVTMNFDPMDQDGQVDLADMDLERELHALWKKAAKRKAANGSYCEAVQTPAAWAKYVTKDLKGERGTVELPPLSWKGRLTSSSPGFYAKAKEELYDDLKRSWGYEVKPRVKKPKKPKAARKVHQPYIPSDDFEIIAGPAPIMSPDTMREPIPAAESSERPADSGSAPSDEVPVVATDQDAPDPLLYLTSTGKNPKHGSFISIISRLAAHALRPVPIMFSILETHTRRQGRYQARHTHISHRQRRSLYPAIRFRSRGRTRTPEARCRGP
jgi:hypothetical protein